MEEVHSGDTGGVVEMGDSRLLQMGEVDSSHSGGVVQWYDPRLVEIGEVDSSNRGVVVEMCDPTLIQMGEPDSFHRGGVVEMGDSRLVRHVGEFVPADGLTLRAGGGKRLEMEQVSILRTPSTILNDTCSYSSSSLIPGLPDEITIDHVVTRLPWRMLSTVFSLSRAWKDAITNRQVYDARVRTSSTQTIVAMAHFDTSLGAEKWTNLVSVYDTSTFKWHLLPQIPRSQRGVPNLCCCVSSQGKLYVIGGANRMAPFSTNEVHSFDPTGPGRWERCASMASPRQSFGSGVKDGKIYVFGGAGADRLSEVYDPAQDSWHPIAPMPSFRLAPKVVCVQNEFMLHSGVHTEHESLFSTNEHFAEVYNIRNDEWRRVDNCIRHGQRDILFEISGKLHSMYDARLDSYNNLSSSWEVLQSISWNILNRKGASNIHAFPAAVVALDGELLALVYRYSAGRGVRLVPLKSDGLGMRNRELGWKKIPCSVPLQWDWLCSIEL